MLEILIADDETPIREWIQYSIERENNPRYHVIGAAQNGKEAFELALQLKPDVMFVDIKMPGMDGLTLMRKVLEVLPYTCVIILTNYAEFSYAREAITYGAKKYLLKSEIKGSDIIAELELITERHQEISDHKEKDHYSNGYLDIYDCYRNGEDQEFLSEFWRRHSIKDEPYAVAGMVLQNSSEQKKWIEKVSGELNLYHLNPVLQQKYILVVFQNPSKMHLTEMIQEFIRRYRMRFPGLVGISAVQERIESIMVAMIQAERLLLYHFFGFTESISFFEAAELPMLDHNEVRKKYRSLMERIPKLEKKEDADAHLEAWFQRFKRISYADVSWGHEMCIKMVMAMEEKYHTAVMDSTEIVFDSKELDTMEHCLNLCRTMIKAIYENRNEGYSEVIRETLDYIHQNYQNEISLNEVAGHVFRSPEYLSRQFKRETGEKFSTYLMVYRLDKARVLLENTDMKVYEVAYAVGYTTPSYFSKIYRKYVGVVPEETKGRNSYEKSK